MDFQPWWLIIIPVVFALGWLAARFDFRQMLSETKALPASYFKGLNFLLNEEPDRAIDAFIEVAKLDPETTELHFALGNLFRRRGEIERAIRVHQSLLSRPDLPLADRENAQLELAQDFLKAGLLDRAELGFKDILQTRHALAATRALIRIYESEHDWPKAIETVQQLRGLVDEPVPALVHYYCEIAQTNLTAKPANTEAATIAIEAAENALDKTGASLASNTRVLILKAQLAKLKGNTAEQKIFLEEILDIAPNFAGLIADDLINCYEQLDQLSDGINYLQQQYQKNPTLDLFNTIFRALRLNFGIQQAWEFAKSALRAQPSLLGLDRLLEVELAQNDEQTSNYHILPGTDLSLLRTMIHKHTQRLDRYECNNCGFQARRYYWQCPGCNTWETYKPLRLEEIK